MPPHGEDPVEADGIYDMVKELVVMNAPIAFTDEQLDAWPVDRLYRYADRMIQASQQ